MLAPLSSVTMRRFEVGLAMIDTAHCNTALKLKSLNATIQVQSDRLLLPHLFRLRWVTIRWNEVLPWSLLLCEEREVSPSPPDHHTPTLCSQSVLLFYERHTSCSVRFDTSVKELWHRVISSGHSPSADVRKQSHSCGWNSVLCDSIRGAAPTQETFPYVDA